jgi:hypothetical protein
VVPEPGLHLLCVQSRLEESRRCGCLNVWKPAHGTPARRAAGFKTRLKRFMGSIGVPAPSDDPAGSPWLMGALPAVWLFVVIAFGEVRALRVLQTGDQGALDPCSCGPPSGPPD